VQTLEPEQRQELQRQMSLREQLYEILAIATQFYQHALRQSQGSSKVFAIVAAAGGNNPAVSTGLPSWLETLPLPSRTKRYSVQLVEQGATASTGTATTTSAIA